MRKFFLRKAKTDGWGFAALHGNRYGERIFTDQTGDTKTPLKGNYVSSGSKLFITSVLVCSAPDQAATDLPMSSMLRFMALTFAALTCRSRDVSLMPLPDAKARSICAIWIGAMGGLPRRLLSRRARSSPARTRSEIIARSNSAKTDNMPNSIRPDGVLVSRAC